MTSESTDEKRGGRKGRATGPGSGGSAGDRHEEEPAPGFFPDLLRRGLTLGFTGVFMTEEAIRRALGDSVPRDVVEFVLEQSERTRAELLDRLSREFGRVLSALDPVEIARRLLEGRTVEVTARVRLVPERERSGTKGARGDAGREEEEDD